MNAESFATRLRDRDRVLQSDEAAAWVKELGVEIAEDRHAAEGADTALVVAARFTGT
jgi:hypothetical protein